MAMEGGNGRRIGRNFNCVPHSRVVMQTVTDQHYWGTAGAWEIWQLGGRKRLPVLLDIRNLEGKVDVFFFVYRASTATSVL